VRHGNDSPETKSDSRGATLRDRRSRQCGYSAYSIDAFATFDFLAIERDQLAD
jgi:hypothetical protein